MTSCTQIGAMELLSKIDRTHILRPPLAQLLEVFDIKSFQSINNHKPIEISMSASTSARAIATLRKTSLTSRTPCLRRTSPSTIIARASPLRNNSVAGPSCALRTLSRTYATQNKMSSPPEKKVSAPYAVHSPTMYTQLFPGCVDGSLSQDDHRVPC
jgi:hypothetical protein